jgi:hypothetical protein
VPLLAASYGLPVPACAGTVKVEVQRAVPTDSRNSSIQPSHGSEVTAPTAPTANTSALSVTVPLSVPVLPSCTPSMNSLSELPVRTSAT